MRKRSIPLTLLCVALAAFACERPRSDEQDRSAPASTTETSSDTTGEAVTALKDRAVPPNAAGRKVSPEALALVLEMERGQQEMNAEADSEMEQSKQELQTLLDQLHGMVRGNGARAAKARELLVASQAAWLKFASAQIALEWPDPAAGRYGSVHDMCHAQRWTKLIQDRIEQLRTMVTVDEGYVCMAAWPDDEE